MPPKGLHSMEASNWRAQLPQAARQSVVQRIRDKIQSLGGQRDISRITSIALSFEERVFKSAISQEDYVKKICLKFELLQTESQRTLASSSPLHSTYPASISSDHQASHSLPQLCDQGQSHSNRQADSPQACNQLFFREVQDSIASSMVQRDANFPSTVTSSTQISMAKVVNKNLKSETPCISQTSLDVVRQGLSSNNSANSQTQELGKQHALQVPQPDQRHIQNAFSQQSVMQGSSVIQTSLTQSPSSCGLQQNHKFPNQLHLQSGLPQHPQSVVTRHQQPQCPAVYQQATLKLQKQILPLQHQQLPNVTNVQNRLKGQESTFPYMQYQHMVGQNNHSTGDVSLLGQRTNASRLISQASNSSMQSDQQTMSMRPQDEAAVQQQTQHAKSDLYPTHGKQPQSQPPNLQLMSQKQAQSVKLQLQPNQLWQDMQRRPQTSGSLLELQKEKLSTPHGAFPDVTSTLDCTYQARVTKGDDWKEEVYQKIKWMKDMYLSELTEVYRMLATKSQQLGSTSQHLRTCDPDKVKMWMAVCNMITNYLRLQKPQITRDVERKLGQNERWMHQLLRIKPKRPLSSLQQEGNVVNSPVQNPAKASQSCTSSPNSGGSGKVGLHISDAVSLSTPLVISTPGLSPSPFLVENDDIGGNHNNAAIDLCDSSVAKEPIQRLVEVVRSMSYEALRASVSDIESVVSTIERTGGSRPGNGSRSAVGEDLVPVSNFYFRGENPNGNLRAVKMRRFLSASCATRSHIMASAVSITDRIENTNDAETCDVESTGTFYKKPRVQVKFALFKEIREINQHLIDTVVDICGDGVNSTAAVSVIECGEGTIVRCSFIAVAISPKLKSEHASAVAPSILPLRLFVPSNYPNCSPIFLDQLPAEVSSECEDLSLKAKSKLSVALQNRLQPLSLREIARSWDTCARAVVSEYAQLNGGGTFSSRYGTWESPLNAA